MRELAMPRQSKSALWPGMVIGVVLVAATTFLVVKTTHTVATSNSASSDHSTQTAAPTHSATGGPSPHATSKSRSTTLTSAMPAGPWVLTWDDEFKSTAGLSRWSFVSGSVIGGSGGTHPLHELQWWDQSNATVSNGNLVLTATKGLNGHSCWYGQCDYTSVRMMSTFSQTYGLYEARIKLPAGQGIWPAFWMQGSQYSTDPVGAGEIDIAEQNNRPPLDRLGGYTHTAQGINYFYHWMSEPVSASYHVYGIAWTPSRITFFVDGTPYGHLDAYPGWPYNHPFNIILSLAVGGGWPGPPTASTHFPVRMYVNWLRVYKHG